MLDVARVLGLARGGHLFFGARQLGIWGLVLVLLLVFLLAYLSSRRR